jgi:hypothetical protein
MPEVELPQPAELPPQPQLPQEKELLQGAGLFQGIEPLRRPQFPQEKEQPKPAELFQPKGPRQPPGPLQPAERSQQAQPSPEPGPDSSFPQARSFRPTSAQGPNRSRRYWRGRSGAGLPRLSLIAGTLAVLIVLGGVAFGIDRWYPVNSPANAVTGTSLNPHGDATPGSATASVGSTPGGSATAAVTVTASPGPLPTTGANVKLGVFRGTSPSQVRSFESWLGRDVDYVEDFSTRATWSQIANPNYMIGQWRGSRHRMVYSVALLPQHQSGSIKVGATGEYDRYYRTLARNLVAGGQQDAILRLGWEFNLGSSHWSTADNQAFISYWRHIVTAMRSVPGQKLKFDWNLNVGDTTHEAVKYYPGDAYVDYVGIDVYDVSWTPDTYPYASGCSASCRRERQELVWQRLYNGQYGLAYWSQFAKAKHKPISLPEWGLWSRPDGHGGGDDPYFIEQMHAFIDNPQNAVAYQSYFDFNVHDGKHRLTTLQQAGKVFKRLFD